MERTSKMRGTFPAQESYTSVACEKVKRTSIQYAVAIDNDYKIWHSSHNR
jgi:hypothetical protein